MRNYPKVEKKYIGTRTPNLCVPLFHGIKTFVLYWEVRYPVKPIFKDNLTQLKRLTDDKTFFLFYYVFSSVVIIYGIQACSSFFTVVIILALMVVYNYA